jgi:hypothetical protein
MKFIEDWKINTTALSTQKYTLIEGEMMEHIDLQLAKLILDDRTKDEYGNEVVATESRAEFGKLIERITNNQLRFVLKARKGNLGRRYAEIPKKYKYKNGWTTDEMVANEQGEMPTANPLFRRYYSALIAMPRVIKNTIYKYQNWIDIDQRKGHMTILSELGEKNGEDMKAYKDVINNFDGVCDTLIKYHSVEEEEPLEKGDIKWLFNKTIYGGGFSAWAKDIEQGKKRNLEGKDVEIRRPKALRNTTQPHPYYSAFYNKTKNIIDLVYLHNENLQNILCKDIPLPSNEENAEYSTTLWSRKNRVMSYFCGVIENEITYKAYKYLIEAKVIPKGIVDWGYDGFTIPPPAPEINFECSLKEMNQYVRTKTGFKNVEFVVKELDGVLDNVIERRKTEQVSPLSAIIESEEIEETYYKGEILDDEDAIGKIWDNVKKFVKYYEGQYFMKKGNVWVVGEKNVASSCFCYFMKCDLYRVSKKGDRLPHSRMEGGARALTRALMDKVKEENEDPELYKKFHSTTKYRLCFTDGVLDFKERWFKTWEELKQQKIEIYTPVIIHRSFGKYFLTPNKTTMETIEKDLLKHLFNTKYDTAMRFLARGVAGCVEDKNWATYMGNRNCGKGVFEVLGKNAIGSYYTTIQSANLLMKQRSSGDVEKENYWILPLQFARLAVSQEVPENSSGNAVKLNGEIFKRLCSGGDSHKARGLYQDPVEFCIQARAMLMCNDLPPFSSPDCLETAYQFSSSIQFKSQAEIDKRKKDGEPEFLLKLYLPADPTIKDKARSEEWANAFIMILYEAFVKPIELAKAEEDKENENEEGTTELRKGLLDCFIFEGTPTVRKGKGEGEWFCSAEKIKGVLANNGFAGTSSQKVNKELKAMGRIKGEYSNKKGFWGLKEFVKPNEEPELEAE